MQLQAVQLKVGNFISKMNIHTCMHRFKNPTKNIKGQRNMNRLNHKATPLLKRCVWATLLASWSGTRWCRQVDNICTEAKREHRSSVPHGAYKEFMYKRWIGTCLCRPNWLWTDDLRQHHGTTAYLLRLISAHLSPSLRFLASSLCPSPCRKRASGCLRN